MFMEDEQAATIYATVTFRRGLLVDNHPHFYIPTQAYKTSLLDYDMIY